MMTHMEANHVVCTSDFQGQKGKGDLIVPCLIMRQKISVALKAALIVLIYRKPNICTNDLKTNQDGTETFHQCNAIQYPHRTDLEQNKLSIRFQMDQSIFGKKGCGVRKT